jgi:hypothetical protein
MVDRTRRVWINDAGMIERGDVMDSPEKVTAQGVRDLNDRGPKRKPAPAVDVAPAPGAAPATGAEDQASAPVAPTEDAAPAAKIDNG